MANIHMFLTGKGGVGKSFCSAMLMQYIMDSGRQNPVCIDTDPVNATLYAYKAFNAIRLEIMDDNGILPRKFDEIIELIAETTPEDTVIIDNGASSFIAFAEYLLSNGIPALLHDMGHRLFINSIVTGGNSQNDTIQGFTRLAENFSEPTKLLVWLNPYHGPIEYNGLQFEDFKAYQAYQDRIWGIIPIPQFKQETFGYDIAKMLKAHHTFREELENPKTPLMTRQRLKMAQRDIYNKIALIPEI